MFIWKREKMTNHVPAISGVPPKPADRARVRHKNPKYHDYI